MPFPPFVGALRPILPAVGAALVASAVLTAVKRPLKPGFLILLGALTAAAVYRESIWALFGVLTITFVTSVLLVRLPEGVVRRRASIVVMVLAVVAAAVGRHCGITRWRVAIAGVEWALLYLDMVLAIRVLSLFWEVGVGRVKQIHPASFGSWVLLPFTLFGPLIRFSEWQAHERGSVPDERLLGSGRQAGALALIQLAGVVALAWGRTVVHSPPLESGRAMVRLADWMLFDPWGFYLPMAAHANLVVALGRLAGIPVPEGFNRPFGRPNLAQFWANWNMPVTSLARDMIFYQRWGLARGDVYLNTFLVFLLIGLWHSGHPYWLVWGLLHAVGYSAHIAFARSVRSGNRLALIIRDVVPGRVLTYAYVCGCWVAPPQIIRLVTGLLQG